ncbi:hypothetical protein K502DRAFT_198734 [Neoconidiobolus thromboides FSU 785]|nr:hypothetical protein K502DRAFT_198734 [Neoconidiobolus thromboides FSU 785]
MTIGSPRARSNSTSRSSSKVRFNDNCYHSNSNPSIRANENQDYNPHPHDGNSYQNEHTAAYRRYKSRSRSLSRSKSPIAHHPGLSYPTGDTADPVDQTEPTTHSREGLRENRNDRDDWYYNKQRGWDDRDVAYRSRDYLESNPGYRSRSHRHEDDLSPGEREYSRDYHYSRGRRKPYFDHYAGSGYHGLDRRRERDSYPSRFDSRPRFNRFRPREYRWDYGDSRGRARNRSREYSRRDHSPSPRYYGRESIQSPGNLIVRHL